MNNCVQYNLLKEGSVVNTNTTVSGVLPLGASSLFGLYDGDRSTPAATVSGAVGGPPRFISLLQEFGEAFDVCFVRYYTDEPQLSHISLSYKLNDDPFQPVSWYQESPGVYRADLNRYTHFLELNHTVSGTASNVYQLEIWGVRNEVLGFGLGPADQIDYYRPAHSTGNLLSSSASAVPVFNDSQYDDYALVSVAPTLSGVDKYLFLSTTKSGTFYGINDFGFTQPGANPIAMHDDSMLTAEGLDPQWERRCVFPPHAIFPTEEGLIFDFDYSAQNLSPYGGMLGLVSRDPFTADSFTVEVQIRFLSEQSTSSRAKDFFFVMTNSYPILDIGYWDQWLTDRQRGTAIVGIAMKVPFAATIDYQIQRRWVDGGRSTRPGAGIDNILLTGPSVEWTGGPGEGYFVFSPAHQNDEVGFALLPDFEDIIFRGASFRDFTETAEWHTWKLSYDSIEKKLSMFVDNIFIGDVVSKIEPFGEATKLFMGFHGDTGVRWALRNFKVYPNKVYRQVEVASVFSGGVATATVSGVNAYKVNDGNTAIPYVGPEPTGNAHVRIDFSEPKDIAFYKIKQHGQSGGVSAFGKTYFADVARQGNIDFGGKYLDFHLFPNTSDTVYRAPTYADSSHTVVSGISYIDFQFTNYDRTTQTNGALIIDEIEVYAEEWITHDPTPVNPREFPWVAGRWNNLKQYGSSSALAIKFRSLIDPGYDPRPELMLEGVDFGFSSARFTWVDSDVTDFYDVNLYHHAGAVFTHQGIGEASRKWRSLPQPDSYLWIWRSFIELSAVKSVYWDSHIFRPSNVADRFKFQYLSEGGNPNVEADWVNIPPIKKTHPFTGGSLEADTNYKAYRDYLIVHNDGEYYRDYYTMPPCGAGFSVGGAFSSIGVPQGLTVPAGYLTLEVVHHSLASGSASTNGLKGYIEFDDAIWTRAIRMVVTRPIDSGAQTGGGLSGQQGTLRTDFGIAEWEIFRTNGAASYASPVFDTGTPQNTERLDVRSKVYEGTSVGIYVRSSDTPPDSAYNTLYEIWESLGRPGSLGIDFNNSAYTPTIKDRVIVWEDRFYFIGQFTNWLYDPKLDLWSTFAGLPGAGNVGDSVIGGDEGTGVSPALLPDDRVDNNAVLVGSRIYVACYTASEQNRTPRLVYYDFEDPVSPHWVRFSFNRPPFTEFATMVGYKIDKTNEREAENRLYFFCEDGTVSYYDIEKNNWIIEVESLPIYGTRRRNIATAVFEDKVYFLGGNNGPGTDGRTDCNVFDLKTKTFRTIASSPYRIKSAQAVMVPEERLIYVFPTGNSGSVWAGYTAIMKYDVDADSWELCESMLWARDAGLAVGGTLIGPAISAYLWYYAPYIYRVLPNYPMLRSYVKRDPWQHGTSPDFRDKVWGGRPGAAIPWTKVDSFGEFMPQDRYIQFKVELYSEDRVNTPILEGLTVVTPQELFVPASGTENVYLKVGVSPEELYEAWYSAAGIRSDSVNAPGYSVLYTKSSTGSSWGVSTVASGSYVFDETSNSPPQERFVASSPWVIKDSIDSYRIWVTRGISNSIESRVNDDANIYYLTTSDPFVFSGDTLVVARGALSQSAEAAKQPCVLQESVNSYKMWYTGLDVARVPRIIRATSTNGISWASHTVALNIGQMVLGYDAAGIYRPCVLKDGLYRMWYTSIDSQGFERILYTQSANAIIWEAPRLILNLGAEGNLDRRGCSKAYVLRKDEEYVMYYLGFDGTYRSIIRATSPDGFEWFNFRLSVPAGGLGEFVDGNGLEDIFVLLNEETVIPGSMIEGAQIKLYNKRAAQ